MLKEGDVFKLENGMKVSTNVPEKFVYSNRRFSNELINKNVVVGDEMNVDVTQKVKARERIVKNVIEAFANQGADVIESNVESFVKNNTNVSGKSVFVFKQGEFIVTETKMDGGSERDFYPNGHHVFAKRLNEDGTYNPDGETIDFYQSGSFTLVSDKDIKVVRKMTPVKTVTTYQ